MNWPICFLRILRDLQFEKDELIKRNIVSTAVLNFYLENEKGGLTI